MKAECKSLTSIIDALLNKTVEEQGQRKKMGISQIKMFVNQIKDFELGAGVTITDSQYLGLILSILSHPVPHVSLRSNSYTQS